MFLIKDIIANSNSHTDKDRIELVAVCDRVIQGVASNGQQYLTISLKDSTGNIEMRLWNATPDDISSWKKGNVYKIIANAIEYKKTVQLKSINYKLIPLEEVDFDQFLESAPIDSTKIYDEIFTLFCNLKNQNYKKLMLAVLDQYGKQFKIWPAAIRNHHEIKSGLMWHSYTMLKTAQALSKIYSDRLIDFELLYAGVILHDLGKVIEIKADISSDFTLEGKLLGHISIMSAQIAIIGKEQNIDAETVTLLQHLILASHGKLEFGSPVEPHLMEAEILSFLDNLDARIYRIDKELKNIDINASTPLIPSLEKRWFIRHK